MSPDVKRSAVSDVMDRHGLSERRACELADLHRSVFQYNKQGRRDEVLRKRLHELANERRRIGYRRLSIHLTREGFEVDHKKLFRLYREKGWLCGVDGRASGPWARAGQFWFWIALISVDRSTSWRRPLKMASGSTCYALWMIVCARRGQADEWLN
jgi:hypothetical protein